MTSLLAAPVAPQLPPALFIQEEQSNVTLADTLLYGLSRALTAEIHLEPQPIVLHLHEGRIRAAQGYIPLGQILLREGWCTEEVLERALEQPGKLGQNLLDLRVKALHVRQALKIQVQKTLAFLQVNPPQRYELRGAAPLPSPGAGLERGEVMELLLSKQQELLPLGNVYQLSAPCQPIELQVTDLELLRWINGRRSLGRAMELTNMAPKDQHAAARKLLTLGLLEPSVVFGLRLIVPRIRPSDHLTQPPANLRANLFVRRINAKDSVATIAQQLRIPEQEACLIMTSLYRDRVIEIEQGEQEFLRLLEEF